MCVISSFLNTKGNAVQENVPVEALFNLKSTNHFLSVLKLFAYLADELRVYSLFWSSNDRLLVLRNQSTHQVKCIRMQQMCVDVDHQS